MTDSWPIHDRHLTDSWPILDRYMTDTSPIIDRRLTDTLATLHQNFTDTQIKYIYHWYPSNVFILGYVTLSLGCCMGCCYNCFISGSLCMFISIPVLLDRFLADTRPILGRHLTDSWPAVDRYISADESADRRPTDRGTIGRPSVKYRALYRPTVGRLSADCRPTNARESVDIAADISTEATYSTHDPRNLRKIYATVEIYL